MATALIGAEETRKVLEGMSVEGWPGVYVLGCIDRRVTIYSQQVRALNLAAALVEFHNRLLAVARRDDRFAARVREQEVDVAEDLVRDDVEARLLPAVHEVAEVVVGDVLAHRLAAAG